MNPKSALEFAKLCGLVKNVKRKGWLFSLPADKVESVADHSHRIALLTMALHSNGGKFNQLRCMEMALVHDIGEGIIGDFTPHCGVPQQEKHEQ
jgi:putative hydrolase of HD superfamily